MKLLNFQVKNFVAIKEANIKITKPINFFIGSNEQGKSSLAAAFEMLISGLARGLTLKKNRHMLINAGAKSAEIMATLDNGMILRRTITPTGDTFDATVGNQRSTAFPFPYNAIATNPFLFFEKDADERKKLLYALVAGGADQNTIKDKLMARGISETLAVNFAVFAINFGFPKAKEKAVEKRREAKRELEELNKIEAPSLSVTLDGDDYVFGDYTDPKIVDAITTLEAERDALLTKKGSIESAVLKSTVQEDLATLDAQLAQATKDAGAIADPTSLKTQLEKLQQEHADFTAKILAAKHSQDMVADGLKEKTPDLMFVNCPVMDAVVCPVTVKDRKGFGKIIADRVKRAKTVTEEADAEIAQLTERQKEVADKAGLIEAQIQDIADERKKSDRKLLEIRSRMTALQNLLKTAVDEVADASELRTEIDEIAGRLDTGRQLLAAFRAYTRAGLAYRAAKDSIVDVEKTIAACNLLDAALAPDGIQSELTTDALGPFRERIQKTGATMGGSMLINDEDFLPVWRGHHYFLCSESAKWRCRLIFQESIAYFSKTPLLIIDEASILDYDKRGNLFDLFAEIQKDYSFIGAFATQATEDVAVFDDPDIAFWKVESGTVTALKAQAEAAAA